MSAKAVNDFMEVTGTSRTTANKYLKKHAYNLNFAVEEYLGKQYNTNLYKLFEKYQETPDKIGIDGTLCYLEDLGIEPEDVRSLVLSHFLESESMGAFSKENFLQKWTEKNISTISQMKTYLNELTKNMATPSEFDELYGFTFNFLLETPTQRSLSPDLLIDYWKLLFDLVPLDEDVLHRIDQWYDFILKQEKPSNKDAYLMFWEFVKEVVKPDPGSLSGYDEMASWPVVIDEFIEYLQENNLLESTES
ncbi:Scaffold-type E3 ligase [Yamadazyma tenuis]|uniref:Defective in cullin neddylation protein n=1 Tax=Candida tenuis (strain ATCC 10573 / BCRC 21748 / CBS 615 / JCM 9827 / NBRC 10315 / NRRL Y-1498 / VKM Y-70) TaxID=590646 RepID=G3B9I5_CANTC|nr:DUF298-domain-containing protein [Yamadazyma tenuis ATCC 10573]EGV61896.1 DUF298-domain-containing protein [Yamadazyma tenuis ATCC 10573]WEJ93129.1 Scaffold-type E3 ligase [Yamadazyma tenuis]